MKLFTLYFAGSCLIFFIWVWGAETPSTSLNGDPRSTLHDLVGGTAHKPFVQRALVPALTRATMVVLGKQVTGGIEDAMLSIPKVRKEAVRLGWDTDHLAEHVLALSLSFLSLFGWAFVVRRLWMSLYETAPVISDSISIICLMFLPAFFHVGTHYIYDFPALLFFNAGILLLIRNRWTWFYPVFVLGCLNKETMLFTSIGFLLLNLESVSRKRTMVHLSIQLLLFTIIRVFVNTIFESNPGVPAEFHLFGNIHRVLLGYDLGGLVIALLFAGLALFRFRTKATELQRLIWLFPIAGVLVLLFGVISETRSWMELLPIGLFLCLHTILFDILGISWKEEKAAAQLS